MAAADLAKLYTKFLTDRQFRHELETDPLPTLRYHEPSLTKEEHGLLAEADEEGIIIYLKSTLPLPHDVGALLGITLARIRGKRLGVVCGENGCCAWEAEIG